MSIRGRERSIEDKVRINYCCGCIWYSVWNDEVHIDIDTLMTLSPHSYAHELRSHTKKLEGDVERGHSFLISTFMP
jgi:hypothetical protein